MSINQHQSNVEFVFYLDSVTCIKAIGLRNSVWYSHKSLGAKVILAIARRMRKETSIEQINYHLINSTQGIKKNAFETAKKFITRESICSLCNRLETDLELPTKNLLKRLIFERVYSFVEYLGIKSQYRSEESDDKNTRMSKKSFSFEVSRQITSYPTGTILKYIFPFSTSSLLFLAILPAKIIFQILLSKYTQDQVSHKIVCEVDSPQTKQMFDEILRYVDQEMIVYKSRQPYADSSTNPRVSCYSVSHKSLKYLLRVYRRVISRITSSFLDSIGLIELFSLAYRTIHTAALFTLNGNSNLFLTFEHHSAENYVRNALLSASQNVSAFICLNSYVMPQYGVNESFLNYDMFFSAGPHNESHYTQRYPEIRNFLKAGAFSSHLAMRRYPLNMKESRLDRRIKNLDKSKQTVIYLSPGICDYTYNHEKRMLSILGNLALHPEVIVIVRQKPVEPAVKYIEFYRDFNARYPQIVMTSSEYDLFEFADLDGLFITSYSTSAYDLCQLGRQVLFVNILDDRSYHEPLQYNRAILVDEPDALLMIKRWLHDDDNERHAHSLSMADLVDRISFLHNDYSVYLSNIRSLLDPHINDLHLASIAQGGCGSKDSLGTHLS